MKDFIENIVPSDYKIKGSYTPAKKIDMGNFYLVFVSGVQAPMDEKQRVIADGVEEQTKLVFESIAKILSQAGASLDDVVKAVIYVTDMSEFDKISKIRGDYFRNSMPASTLVKVDRMAREGAKIEIEVTAVVGKKAMSGSKDLKETLKSLKVTCDDIEYGFASIENESSVDSREVLATFHEDGRLAIIAPVDYLGSQGIDYEGAFAKLTIDLHTSLELVGLTAVIAAKLAEHGISANVVAAFYHDHIFVQFSLRQKAVKLLESLRGD